MFAISRLRSTRQKPSIKILRTTARRKSDESLTCHSVVAEARSQASDSVGEPHIDRGNSSLTSHGDPCGEGNGATNTRAATREISDFHPDSEELGGTPNRSLSRKATERRREVRLYLHDKLSPLASNPEPASKGSAHSLFTCRIACRHSDPDTQGICCPMQAHGKKC